MKAHDTSANSLRLTAPLEFKFAGAAAEIEGYGSIFGLVDSYGETVEAGAFEKSLARHSAESTLPAMLWSHDPGSPIGHWTEMFEDEQGLRVRGRLNLQSERGQQAQAHIRAGDVGGLSIGFVPLRSKRNSDGSRALVEVDLLEVSVVAMPANRRARIISLKQAQTLPEFEVQLRSIGYSRSEARKLALRAWPKPDDNVALNQLSDRVETATREFQSMKGFFK